MNLQLTLINRTFKARTSDLLRFDFWGSLQWEQKLHKRVVFWAEIKHLFA